MTGMGVPHAWSTDDEGVTTCSRCGEPDDGPNSYLLCRAPAWTAEEIARAADLPPCPQFSFLRHRTMKRYQRALDQWSQECARRRLVLFDAFVASLATRRAPR